MKWITAAATSTTSIEKNSLFLLHLKYSTELLMRNCTSVIKLHSKTPVDNDQSCLKLFNLFKDEK